jgi:hypothetical protein
MFASSKPDDGGGEDTPAPPPPPPQLGVCEWGREVGRLALNALPVYCFNVSQFANNILSQGGGCTS